MILTRTLRLFLAVVVTLAAWPLGTSMAQKAKGDEVKPILARIALLERNRKIERTAWRKFVRHEHPQVRAAGIRGLGRTQDPRGAQLIKDALADDDVRVRREAAFAYGQLPGGKITALKSRLEIEADDGVRELLVEAMGKRASLGDVATLVALADGKSAALAGRALVGLGLLARREKVILPMLGGQRIAGWLGHEDLRVRTGAAYLLMRSEKMTDAETFAAVARAARDANAEIRAMALRASGRFTDGAELRKAGTLDRDWRVRIEALRAAGKRKEVEIVAAVMETHVAALIEGIAPPSTEELHPGLTAAKTALELPVHESTTAAATKLYEATKTQKAVIRDVETGGTVLGNAHLHCAAAALMDRAKGKVEKTKTCGAVDYPVGLREDWQVKASTSLADPQRMDFLIELYKKAGTMGRMAVLQALPELKSQPDAGDLLLLGLTDPDSAVAGTAADLAPEMAPEGVEMALIAAYNAMYPAQEYEAVQSVFVALGKLKAKKAIEILERHTTDPQAAVSWAANQALEQIGTMEKRMGRRQMLPPPAEFFEQDAVDVRLAEPSKVTRATLHTTKGPVVIDLFERQARETVKNFSRLAGRQFYDGLVFHRVVPGFVAQTGDPKGNGWGGPGHSIKCEVNPNRYGRGAVGMALSAKDTGGSQFFITHAAHPHLDGTYTVFGQVTEGMPVVDALAVGDRILRVELHRGR